MGWATCPGTRIDQVVVTFENGRALSVVGTPCTKRLSARTALAQARRFFPPDARARGTVTGPLGRASLYVSAQLGRALSGDDFNDCDGNAAPRGSFILTVSASASDGYWWQLQPGTCNAG
jgi:hypothetical protein